MEQSVKVICREGSALSLTLNKEADKIAVSGRNLLKVFSINSDGFTEVHNMNLKNTNKNHNLSYSSMDVDWNHIEGNLLATGATNGVVSIWDLNKFGKQKQLICYSEHERTTHTVSWHSSEGFLLLSGSQDGLIKLFDIRTDKSVSTFQRTESVRCVKFSPQTSNSFASVTENGTVVLWDLRKTEKCLYQFTAHSGPIYTCDWHPTNPWLATGSRDKAIKIWNLTTNKPQLEYLIHTIAVVGRVKWRPEKKYHIASCALVVDYSIYIWDVRRPYIPYSSFNEHTNVTTDISFQGNNPHVLLSTSKDSTIYKHLSKDACHPAQQSNPQGAAINFRGDLLVATKTKVKPQTPIPTSNSANKLNFLTTSKKAIDAVDGSIATDQFHLAKSTLHSFQTQLTPSINSRSADTTLRSTLTKDFTLFLGCAREYKYTGMSFNELFDHNANVAKKYGRQNVYILWNFIKQIYQTSPIFNTQYHRTTNTNSNRLSAQNSNQSSSGQSRGGSFGTAGLNNPNTSRDERNVNASENVENFYGTTNDDSMESGDNLAQLPSKITNTLIIDTTSMSSMLCLKELTTENIDNVKMFRNGFLYKGPHDLMKELSLNTCLHDLQSNNYKSHMMMRATETSPPPTEIKPTRVLTISEMPEVKQWEPYQVLADSLVLQSEIGDVQTACAILICLGEYRDNLPIDKFIHENWLQSYVELLHRHQLWNEATEILNLSWIPTITEMNQQSTVINTICGLCGKQLPQPGWYCKHCSSFEPSMCAVCNLPAKGLYAWCSQCCHGGHLNHLKEWFENNPKCPKCDHLCEYS